MAERENDEAFMDVIGDAQSARRTSENASKRARIEEMFVKNPKLPPWALGYLLEWARERVQAEGSKFFRHFKGEIYEVMDYSIRKEFSSLDDAVDIIYRSTDAIRYNVKFNTPISDWFSMASLMDHDAEGSPIELDKVRRYAPVQKVERWEQV